MKIVIKVLFIISLTLGNFVYAGTCGYTGGVSYIKTPYGYNKTGEENGVCLFEKGDITVHVADVQSGVKMDFIYDPNYIWGKLNNGNWAKLYTKKSIENLFSYAKKKNSRVITVTNAQFYGYKKGRFFMSFPVKDGRKYISLGPDMRIPSEKGEWDYRILNFNNKKISILPYYKFALDIYGGKSIVGYRYNYRGNDVACRSRIGRTYAAIQERTREKQGPIQNYSPSLLIFNAKHKTCNEMQKIITKWGVKMKDVVMFDGSGSSQFKSKIKNRIKKGDNRYLPMGLMLIGN